MLIQLICTQIYLIGRSSVLVPADAALGWGVHPENPHLNRPQEDSLPRSQGPMPHEKADPLFTVVKKFKMVTGEH